MSFFTIADTILLGPLKLLFEIIFEWTHRVAQHPGISIFFLSLFVNVLVLPLYKRADTIQEEARDVEAKLQNGVAHIKKYFSGDERMMVLQTYYRQNHYKPTDGLKSSVSLLLQIPFFITAYQFLSNLGVLKGASLGPISDLSAPDGLLVLGGWSINCLPILMTLVNVVSGAMYSKGFPLKTKVQLYGIAAFFLVFLYNSPSGLVFYWTLNNVFSLVKTLFYKLKKPGKISEVHQEAKPNRTLFLLGTVFLTILVGVLIPSTYIAASPQEYVDVSHFHNPLWYIVSSACMAIGTFLVWMRIFYELASAKIKIVFERLTWILCVLMLVNYMFFGTKLGILTSSLQYVGGISFSLLEKIVNLLVLILLAGIMYVVVVKWRTNATTVLLTAILAFGIMSSMHLVNIHRSVREISTEASSGIPEFHLSKEGNNVIVIMLDRAMGEYVPYLMNEKPELKEQFAGFTYYSNTISFGPSTNFASPALLGGYEYTPVELNKRNDDSLMTKQNEANLVMPLLFAEQGYDVTVCDPIYANYKWISDLSVFKEYEGIDAYIAKGKFVDEEQKEFAIEQNHRNFFCFSLMKTMPLVLQNHMYNGGRYSQVAQQNHMKYFSHVRTGMTKSMGISKEFMESYNTMCHLSNMTKIAEGSTNTYLFFSNKMTHDPMLLQEPDYTPQERVDNTAIYEGTQERFTVDGKTLKMETEAQVIHYQANMAALIQLGKWFDYMREQDVYDNTKIVLVSDHGRGLQHFEELMYDGSEDMFENVEFYYPLLMVKDFNSQKFAETKEFMTIADVPVLAMQGIIERPKNPFTGKAISSDEKTAHDQYIIISEDWDVSRNDGNEFLPAKWASVKEDLWDLNNWKFYDETIVLREHAFPITE